MSKPDLDELLKILEENQEKRQVKSEALNEDSTKRFIRKNGLIQGLDRIPNYIIYYTYRTKYKPKMGEEKWSKVHFFRLFNKYFDQARTGKYRFYKLDGKSFDLTREGLLEAKKFDEEYTVQIKKERGTYEAPKSEGKRKVSIPKDES